MRLLKKTRLSISSPRFGLYKDCFWKRLNFGWHVLKSYSPRSKRTGVRIAACDRTVAELWLKRLKNTRQDFTSRTPCDGISSSFHNKIGKMKVQRLDFESAASASSAIPAEGKLIEFLA